VGERQGWSSAFDARGHRVDGQRDDPATALPPISEDTPGQDESRTAYQRFREIGATYEWWEEYLELRAAGWTWRKAVYIAWETMPTDRRVPETKDKLATQVLALKSARTVRRWVQKDPAILETVARRQAAALFQYRAGIFRALGEVASMPEPKANADRRLALELMGDYRPRQAVELSGEDGKPPVEMEILTAVAELEDDELMQMLENLETVSEGGPGAGLGEGAHPAGDEVSV